MDVRGDKHKAQKSKLSLGGGGTIICYFIYENVMFNNFVYEKYRFVTFLYTKGNDLNHFVQKSYFS